MCVFFKGIYYLVWHNLHNSLNHCEDEITPWTLTRIDLGFSLYVSCKGSYWGNYFLFPFKYYVPWCKNKTQGNKKITKTLFLVVFKKKEDHLAKPNFLIPIHNWILCKEHIPQGNLNINPLLNKWVNMNNKHANQLRVIPIIWCLCINILSTSCGSLGS